jgi:hypothetical protein
VQSVGSQPTFRRNMSLPSTGSKNKPSKKPASITEYFVSEMLVDLQGQCCFTTGGLPSIISPLATIPLTVSTRDFISQLNTCGYSPYVTSSVTGEWVCRLQLLLALASVVILRSESLGTHDILLPQIRDSPNLKCQVPEFISPRNRVARFYPQALGSFSSPPATRRATVEVFDSASTRD